MGFHLHAQFRLANRAAIEDEIERLINLLDMADGVKGGDKPGHRNAGVVLAGAE